MTTVEKKNQILTAIKEVLDTVFPDGQEELVVVNAKEEAKAEVKNELRELFKQAGLLEDVAYEEVVEEVVVEDPSTLIEEPTQTEPV